MRSMFIDEALAGIRNSHEKNFEAKEKLIEDSNLSKKDKANRLKILEARRTIKNIDEETDRTRNLLDTESALLQLKNLNPQLE